MIRLLVIENLIISFKQHMRRHIPECGAAEPTGQANSASHRLDQTSRRPFRIVSPIPIGDPQRERKGRRHISAAKTPWHPLTETDNRSFTRVRRHRPPSRPTTDPVVPRVASPPTRETPPNPCEGEEEQKSNRHPRFPHGSRHATSFETTCKASLESRKSSTAQHPCTER